MYLLFLRLHYPCISRKYDKKSFQSLDGSIVYYNDNIDIHINHIELYIKYYKKYDERIIYIRKPLCF